MLVQVHMDGKPVWINSANVRVLKEFSPTRTKVEFDQDHNVVVDTPIGELATAMKKAIAGGT